MRLPLLENSGICAHHHDVLRSRDPLSRRSPLDTQKVITQGDSEHALMAAVLDACALLTCATPRTSLVGSKGSDGAPDRPVQSVEGLARGLRLDLLSR